MSFQQIPGGGMWVPTDAFRFANPPAFLSISAIAATGDKAVWLGRVSFKGTGTKNIQTLGFRFGNVVKAGGSALSVSLQGVSATSGPPMQPDGIKGQTSAVVNSNASFASNAWITCTFSPMRAVSYGDLLSVVIEYDASGRLGSDTFVTTGISLVSAGLSGYHGQGAVSLASVWTAFNAPPNVVIGFDDGTFGTLYGGFPVSNIGSLTYGSASATDEYALGFQLPFPAKLCGMQSLFGVATGGDFSVVLYAGTTALQTVSVNSKMVAVQPNARTLYLPIPETALDANTLYRLSIRPDTANQVSFYYIEVASAAHFQAHGGGPSWCLYNRVDGGAWNAPVVTRRPYIALEFSAFDDGRQQSMAMII